MKKLLLASALLVASGMAYADCPNNAQKIVNRIKSHNVNAVNVTYSPDKATWAQDIKKEIMAIDGSLTVNLVPTNDGTGICKFSKA